MSSPRPASKMATDPRMSLGRKELERKILTSIAKEAEHLGPLRIMHVCGTHERSIEEAGIRSLLPPGLRLIAGPGCPVCVCPASDIRTACELALQRGVIIAAFGDMLAVPAPGGSLLDARSRGADIRLIYSAQDAITIARDNPRREVVFFSVGFETTAATAASVLRRIGRDILDGTAPGNFSILPSNRLIPPALEFLFSQTSDINNTADVRAPRVDGLLLPGHVSVIIGEEPYRPIAEKLGLPCAIAGFESLDMLAAILDILEQRKEGSPRVSNTYTRAVRPRGNIHAQHVMAEVFDIVDASWRGIGVIPRSGFVPAADYREFDAFEKFGVRHEQTAEGEASGCRCAAVMLGAAESEECPLFARSCRPDDPAGPCMVSDEGTCRIRFECGGYE